VSAISIIRTLKIKITKQRWSWEETKRKESLRNSVVSSENRSTVAIKHARM